MNEVNLLKGLKITTDDLSILRLFIEDTLRKYIGLRLASSGVVMRTDVDTSFKVTMNVSGVWTVAAGHIITDDYEIITNPIAGLEPQDGLEPGDLDGSNPLEQNIAEEQYILVQTYGKTQKVDVGKIAVTATSDAVVGTNTAFTKYVKAGMVVTVSGSALGNNGNYTIDVVTDDTHLTTVENFTATESNLKFKVLGTYFEGYPVGGDKSLYTFNSFSFRTSTLANLAGGEYLLAKCVYAGGEWTATDMRSSNRFSIPELGTTEIANLAVTLAKMATGSVDENKLLASAFTGALAGSGGGVKFNVKNLGIVTAMIDNLAITAAKLAAGAVTLAKMADESVDHNKIASTSFAAGMLIGGSGTQISIATQTKFSAYRTGTNFEIPHSTLTEIIFNAENYDIGSCFNLGTGMFVAPFTKYYHFDMNLTFDSFAFDVTKFIYIYLYVNGVPAIHRRFFGNGGTFYWTAGFGIDVALTALDSVVAKIVQNTGSSIFINTGAYVSVFSGHLIL